MWEAGLIQRIKRKTTRERQNIRKQTPKKEKTGTGNVRDMLEGGGNTSPQGVGICSIMSCQ